MKLTESFPTKPGYYWVEETSYFYGPAPLVIKRVYFQVNRDQTQELRFEETTISELKQHKNRFRFCYIPEPTR